MVIRGKVIRKTIVLLLVIWIVLLAVLYLTSGKYRDHGIEILRNQLSKNLLTEIQIHKDDIQFSLFKNFPNAAITLKDIYVRSADGADYTQFRYAGKDTLLFAGRVDLILDLWSLMTKKYVLKRINIERGVVNLLTDSKGDVNYNVWLKPLDNDTTHTLVEYDIGKIEMKQMKVNYLDNKLSLYYSGVIDKMEASGNFSNEDFRFKTKVQTQGNKIKWEKHKISHPGKASLVLDIKKEGTGYALKDGLLTAFGIPVQVSGSFDEKDKSYHLKCKLDHVPLQKLDESFIRLHAKDLKFYPQRGEVFLEAELSGNARSENKIEAQFSMHQSVFLNREMGIKLEGFNAKGSFTNGKYRNKISSLVQFDTLYFKSGKSRLSMSGSAANLDAPVIRGLVIGTVELDKLMVMKEISDKYVLDGIADADFRFDGKLSSIQNIGPKDLKAVKMQGVVKLEDAYIEQKGKTFPEVTLNGLIRLKNLMEIDLEGLDLKTGKSQLRVNGSVDNLPQFSSDKSVFPIFRGKIHSVQFHVEDFLIENEDERDIEHRFEFPDSVYLSGSFILDKFYFDNFYATHVTGDFQYRPKILHLNGFNMYSQGGRIESYQVIEQKGDRIYTNSKAEFIKIDISDLFYAFNEFNLDVITHTNIDGILTGTAEVKVAWDLALNPVFDEIVGHSDISIADGELNDYEPMMGLSKFIKIDELRHIKFDRMLMNIDIREKNLHIAQTNIRSSIFTIAGSGDHRFDNTYTYRIQIQLADVLWRKAKNRKPQNTEFGYIVDDGLGRNTIPLMITGKDTLYTVVYDKKTARSNLRDKLSKERDEWINFLRKDKKKEKEEEEGMKFEWNDEGAETIESQQTPSETQIREEDDEFIIEWDGE